MNTSPKPYYLLVVLAAAVVLGMLYFGFRLNGFHPENNARWVADEPGISFGRYGIAYTEPIVWPKGENGFSLEIALQPESLRGGIYFILVVHSGADAHQLLIGQWQSKLIIMHGDDYENRRKTPKITLDIDGSHQEAVLVSIVSGKSGTRLYLNGEMVKENAALTLKWPGNGQAARLALGNSVYGHHSWRGAIKGLAVYAHGLTRAQVGGHYRAWRKYGNFDFAKPEAPEMLYVLDEGAGELAQDRSGNGYHLNVPASMKILKKEVLVPPQHAGQGRWHMIKDLIVNFVGFWPLGFVTAALLAGRRRFGQYYPAGVMLTCFLFSLGIEMGQVWIPSRTSSLLDLILNTLGGAVGALLFAVCRKWFQRISSG